MDLACQNGQFGSKEVLSSTSPESKEGYLEYYNMPRVQVIRALLP